MISPLGNTRTRCHPYHHWCPWLRSIRTQTFSWTTDKAGNTYLKEIRMLCHFRWVQVHRQITDTPSQSTLTRSRSLLWISCRFQGRDFLVGLIKAMLQTQSKFALIQHLLIRRKSFCQLITASDIQKLVAYQDHWYQISAPLKRPGTGSSKMGIFILSLNLILHRSKAKLMNPDQVNRKPQKALVLKFRKKKWSSFKTTFRRILYKTTVTIFRD